MEIQFIPLQNNHALNPIPSIKNLPNWYKQKSPHINGEKKDRFTADGDINATIKRCNPVGDAFNMGYFILLDNAINVTKDKEGNQYLEWARGGENFISTHSEAQIDPTIVPTGFSKRAYKFANPFGIKTPKGYSTLFTHPLNRPELPFYTLQGVVDTDTYNNAVNFPFFIKADFEGIIDAGTPIVQVIPVKRDSWTHFVTGVNHELKHKFQIGFDRYKHRWYKTFYWNKKEYK